MRVSGAFVQHPHGSYVGPRVCPPATEYLDEVRLAWVDEWLGIGEQGVGQQRALLRVSRCTDGIEMGLCKSADSVIDGP